MKIPLYLFIKIDENTDTIKIINRQESIDCFEKRYKENGEIYEAAFNYAMNQVAA